MIIKRRYPNFVSGFEKTEHEVTTKEELLAIDWVKLLCEGERHMGMFCSPTTNSEYPSHLMSLFKTDDGKIMFYVVGYIYGDPEELGLEDYINYI